MLHNVPREITLAVASGLEDICTLFSSKMTFMTMNFNYSSVTHCAAREPPAARQALICGSYGSN